MNEAAEWTKRFRTSEAVAFALQFQHYKYQIKKLECKSDGRNDSFAERLIDERKDSYAERPIAESKVCLRTLFFRHFHIDKVETF